MSSQHTAGVSIHNPQHFNPDWLDLLSNRYVGGSRHQTVLGLLSKAWIKSGRTLTRLDLAALQSEMDAALGGYLRRTYGRHVLEADIATVMRLVASPAINHTPSSADRLSALTDRVRNLRKT